MADWQRWDKAAEGTRRATSDNLSADIGVGVGREDVSLSFPGDVGQLATRRSGTGLRVDPSCVTRTRSQNQPGPETRLKAEGCSGPPSPYSTVGEVGAPSSSVLQAWSPGRTCWLSHTGV